eukprot:scaffold182683_cov32-Tisochrysis_lutea.AAC.1
MASSCSLVIVCLYPSPSVREEQLRCRERLRQTLSERRVQQGERGCALECDRFRAAGSAEKRTEGAGVEQPDGKRRRTARGCPTSRRCKPQRV